METPSPGGLFCEMPAPTTPDANGRGAQWSNIDARKYREQAEECRRLAQGSDITIRDMLSIAAEWETIGVQFAIRPAPSTFR
jgi:hypothetical protein